MSDSSQPPARPYDQLFTRLMGAFFLVGAACFLIGPLGAYANRVGANIDAVTFFGGSVLFTLGGLTQCVLSVPERLAGATGRATWRTAWVQSIGTVCFNVMTMAAIYIAVGSAHYDRLVWSPNALGSVCFLISGAIFYVSSPRRGWLPERRHLGWWEPSVNLLGCVLFGLSAVAGLAIGSHGSELNAFVANATTSLGAACFLACAGAALLAGQTLKAPRLRQLPRIEEAVEREVAEVEVEIAVVLRGGEAVVAREITVVEREAVAAQRRRSANRR